MIPVRLQLKNFMSYGDGVPPLDFAGIRMACLSGDNGNGKTAILDAITWALFGKTRAPSEDDVVRLGAKEAHVWFDFLIEGNVYRVRRQRGRRTGNTPTSNVYELQIKQEDGGFRSLSGTSARETQAKVQALLRMDYDTFLKTGYLAQNSVDEFARVKESERRKVLANILDLSRYERLEELAKERHKEAADREQDAERDVRSIDADLEREDGYAVALQTAQQRLSVLQEAVRLLQQERETLASSIEKMEQVDEAAREREEKVRDRQDQIRRDTIRLNELNVRISSAQTVADKREQIVEACYMAAHLAEKIKPLEAAQTEAVRLSEEARKLAEVINAEYTKLDRERHLAECDVSQLEGEAKDLARYESEVARYEAEVQGFGDVQARKTEAETERQIASDLWVSLKEQNAGLKTQAEALQKRLTALEESDSALCEYCGQSLPPEKRQGAIAEAEAELVRVKQEMTQLASEGKQAKVTVDKWNGIVADCDRDLRQVGMVQTRLNHALQERLRFAERQKELPTLRRRLEELTQKVNNREYAPQEQERQVQISAQLEKLERTAQELAQVRAELARYHNAERDRFELERADEVLAGDPPQADELKALIEKYQGQVEKAIKQIADLRARTQDLPHLKREHSDLVARIKDETDALGRTEREIGDLEGKLNRCETLKAMRERRVAERIAAARDKDNYKELAGAFGKKGVQALLVEMALPEIEEQANHLLGKMTHGAMQVKLITQKEAKNQKHQQHRNAGNRYLRRTRHPPLRNV